MGTTLTVLCENCAGQAGMIGEHGFGVLIEIGDATYLFDTGPGLSLAPNAQTLGKDLSRVDRIFISHGHYDHTGGLQWAVEQAAPVAVVAHPDVFSRHMADRSNGEDSSLKYVGSPVTRESLEAAGARFHMLEYTTEVVPGIHFVTGVARRPGQTAADTRLVVQQGDDHSVEADPIRDDASLLLTGDHPPVLVLGCAHAGLLNILDHIRSELDVTHLGAVIGGTHLIFSGAELIEKTIHRLEEFAVERVAVCHCTGFSAAVRLATHFKDRFSRASAGSIYRFG